MFIPNEALTWVKLWNKIEQINQNVSAQDMELNTTLSYDANTFCGAV